MSVTRKKSADDQRRSELVDRLLGSTRGLFDIYTIFIGDRLGLYAQLADHGPQTSTELSERTATHERYVREWLEQQAVNGILGVENEHDDAGSRRFFLPGGYREVLTSTESLYFLAPLAQLAIGAASPVEAVLEAFRSGGGVPYEDYGANLRDGQARMNRAMFLHELGSDWFPAIHDVHARLQADPPARVADVGCGAGWSSIGMASTYPKARIDGFDLDASSIEDAVANAAKTDLGDRLTFQVRDASDPQLAGQYDLVTAFECVHDMSDPVSALRGMRSLAGETGVVLVVDEKVAERFSANGDDLERMMYGWSVLHCLPVGMADQPSAETGTVMRTDTLRGYALDAGFSDVKVLPVEHMFFRFYRMVR